MYCSKRQGGMIGVCIVDAVGKLMKLQILSDLHLEMIKPAYSWHIPKTLAEVVILAGDNRISGGKLLSAKTRVVKSRVAKALRMAAQSLHRSQSYLGSYYRRMRTRLGTPKAITAAAHKLARVIYHLLTTGQSYEESGFARCEALHQQRLEHRIRRQARDLGFDLVRSPS